MRARTAAKDWNVRYQASAKGRARARRYRASGKSLAAHARYNVSEKGLARDTRYKDSPKGYVTRRTRELTRQRAAVISQLEGLEHGIE